MYKNKICLSVITIIVILFIVTGCSSNNGKAIESGKDISMFVATDIHYLANNLNDNGEAFQTYLTSGDGRQLNYVDEIVDAFANDIDKKKPDILILSGDLTNNGEKESHLELSEKLKDIEKSAETRVFVIPGNHDILNPWSRGFRENEQYKVESITPNDFTNIYKEFGYDEAMSMDQNSLSYLAAPSKDVYLLMLDTNLYKYNDTFNTPTTNGEISSETLKWIKDCVNLANQNNAQIITVMHHNLLKHSKVLSDGFTIDNSSEAIKIFDENELNLILSGHSHIQDIKSMSYGNSSLTDIATSSLITYPEQYGVLKYIPSQGFDYSTSKVDVEGWAKEKGMTEKDLNNFKEYSKNYFAEASYNKTYEQLSSSGNYSEQEKKLMSETMSLLNINYFGGTAGSVSDEVIKTQGFKIWETADSSFIKEYVMSMIQDSDTNNVKYKIPKQERAKE